MSTNYQKLLDKYDKKSEENKQLKYEYQLLQLRYNTKEKQLNIAIENFEKNAKEKYQPLLDEKDKKIEVQNKEIARLKTRVFNTFKLQNSSKVFNILVFSVNF